MRATTRSAISPGKITLTDGAQQAQDIASLSRDTTNTNGIVTSTPDVNEILNQPADTMHAAQAAGQVMARSIGAYADMTRESALKDAKATKARGDLDAMQTFLDPVDSWDERWEQSGGAPRDW
ncbi:hypothetical protein [Caballeronia sp. LZ032]|uniref:hypothetical protein n=1 Tax=Caballeronia sp. LZ032 TaxID=3038565 RepID=UPI00285DA3FC|nr:hypothetical protein [Caballeronia sp. LZ032]MDR5883482.1 hypothetical protein [Caballeronia sp. LZ032]